MDELDERIVTHLRRDGRAPYTEIAEAVGTSEATVRNRVKQLVEDGTIQRFTVRVRGANVRALVEVQVEVNVNAGKIAEAILGLPGVEEVLELTGDWDIAAVVDVDSTEGLNQVVDGIRDIGSTRATRTRVILTERLPNGGPPT